MRVQLVNTNTGAREMVNLSRVPCVGEMITTIPTLNVYKVVCVKHIADPGDWEVCAVIEVQ